jgi:hypothetical protein
MNFLLSIFSVVCFIVHPVEAKKLRYAHNEGGGGLFRKYLQVTNHLQPIPEETQKRMTAVKQILEKKSARNKEEEARKKDRRVQLERKMSDLNLSPEERQKARGMFSHLT